MELPHHLLLAMRLLLPHTIPLPNNLNKAQWSSTYKTTTQVDRLVESVAMIQTTFPGRNSDALHGPGAYVSSWLSEHMDFASFLFAQTAAKTPNSSALNARTWNRPYQPIVVDLYPSFHHIFFFKVKLHLIFNKTFINFHHFIYSIHAQGF